MISLAKVQPLEAPAARSATPVRCHSPAKRANDFGTGYSALGYLKRFPIDQLKIDRSFVEGLEGDRRDAALVQAILALARGLELDVEAEGIETPGQRQLLSLLGCPLGQGYLFAPPRPPQEIRSHRTTARARRVADAPTGRVSFRTRVRIFFACIALVSIVAIGVVSAALSQQSHHTRADARLDSAVTAARALYAQVRREAADDARLVAADHESRRALAHRDGEAALARFQRLVMTSRWAAKVCTPPRPGRGRRRRRARGGSRRARARRAWPAPHLRERTARAPRPSRPPCPPGCRSGPRRSARGCSAPARRPGRRPSRA
ncbi:MAG: EAL domain-containing protein [Thermoleophilaceae bacterium]|nr:EAL domain-containing protein [Thermoleophilaceae bacterium]